MNTFQERLEKEGLTITDFAQFSGIPKARMYKWRPEGGDKDQEVIQRAFLFITENGKVGVKQRILDMEQGKAQTIKEELEKEQRERAGKRRPAATTTVKNRPRNEAFLLGGYSKEDIPETTKAANGYIDLGNGAYVLITPLVEERAWGGYPRGYKDPEYMENLPKHAITVNQVYRGKYVSFEMRGDSMDNGEERSIKAGDIVTGRFVDPSLYTHSKLHIRKFKEWIIVHADGIIVKEIIYHDVERGIVGIHSYNPDKIEYPDDEIQLKDVRELYNVVQVTKERK